MELSNRIDLISSTGQRIRRIHPALAEKYLRDCAKVEERRGGRIRSIRLRELAAPVQPATPLSVASYLGQRYVFRQALRSGSGEVTARCYGHKDMHADDAALIRESLADVCKPGRAGGAG